MAHDRDYYRCLDNVKLLRLAREEGVHDEIAVVLAERLAATEHQQHTIGCYHPTNTSTGDK